MTPFASRRRRPAAGQSERPSVTDTSRIRCMGGLYLRHSGAPDARSACRRDAAIAAYPGLRVLSDLREIRLTRSSRRTSRASRQPASPLPSKVTDVRSRSSCRRKTSRCCRGFARKTKTGVTWRPSARPAKRSAPFRGRRSRRTSDSDPVQYRIEWKPSAARGECNVPSVISFRV